MSARGEQTQDAVAAGLRLGAHAILERPVEPATLRAAVPAALAGTYLAMVLMMAGVAWAPASIAALLLGTSPVFGLVVEAVADRSWPRPSEVVGTLVAVAGIAVLASG